MEQSPPGRWDENLEFATMPFAGALASRVIHPGVHKELMQIFYQQWGLPWTAQPSFPGSNPISIGRTDMWRLKEQAYTVAEKTDGVRYMLVLCSWRKLPVVVAVDRSLALWLIPLVFSNLAFLGGTIIDGELVHSSQGQWQFHIFDAIRVCGQDLKQENYLTRMANVDQLLQNNYFGSDPHQLGHDSIFQLVRKVFYDKSDMQRLLSNDLCQLDHRTDGLLFTPIDAEVHCGRNTIMFKWKQDNTVDFRISYERERYDPVGKLYSFDLQVLDRETLINADFLRLNQGHIHTLGYHEPRQLHGLIAECRWVDQWWIVVMIRYDKSIPNSILTLQRTKENLKENISLQELVDTVLEKEGPPPPPRPEKRKRPMEFVQQDTGYQAQSNKRQNDGGFRRRRRY